MKRWTYWIGQGVLRGVISFSVFFLISLLLKHQGRAAEAQSTLVFSFIALFIGVTSLIYELDHLTLRKRIGIHFLAMLATVYPTLLLSGWFPVRHVGDALLVFVYFVTAGVAILAVYGIIRWLILHFQK